MSNTHHTNHDKARFAERQRCSTIMLHAISCDQINYGFALAFNTDLTAKKSISILTAQSAAASQDALTGSPSALAARMTRIYHRSLGILPGQH